MKDPYQVLGVARSATLEEIKQVYRALAREWHPDVNPGDSRAEERFKEVSAAYDFLSDAERRGQYDRGEIDATGATVRRTRQTHGAGHGASSTHHASSHGARGGRSGFSAADDADEIFAEMLRRKERARSGAAGGAPQPQKGQDARHGLTVSFLEAATGASKRLTLVTGKSLDVRIPPGSESGQTLRLKGQGYPGKAGGADGDAFIDIDVEPHPYFTRRGNDILLDLPVTLQEAVMGAKITVPTIDGRVVLTVPANSNTDTVLRLKGKGVAGSGGGGDQLVTLRVVLPDNDPELKKFVEKWGFRHGYDPREKAGL